MTWVVVITCAGMVAGVGLLLLAATVGDLDAVHTLGKVLYVGAVAALCVAVFVLVGCGDEYEHGAGVYPDTTTAPTVTVPATTAPADPSEASHLRPRPPSEGSEIAKPSKAQLLATRRAMAGARRFLTGYVPYMYGRYPAAKIRHTTAGMRSKLEREAPRVTADMAKADPHVTALDLSGFQRGRVILLARIADGLSSYPVVLTCEQVRSRWIVVEVR